MEHVVSRNTLDRKYDFEAGALFLIDKPLEWTSFDVVNKIRFCLKHKLEKKKFKVGHAGTLDPLATGLLLLCCGKYTKRIDDLQNQDKSYTFEAKFGATTRSYDSEMEEEELKDASGLTESELRSLLTSFRGDILQKPPMFSAIKKDGKALYKLARKGKELEVEPRAVHIANLELVEFENPFARFELTCSKGTYVRSLAHDLGQETGLGAYVSKLRRTAIDRYQVSDALEIEEVVDFINKV